MISNRLAQFSQRMAVLTLMFILGMLLLNALSWLYYPLGATEGWGFSFAASGVVFAQLATKIEMFPGWQTFGAIFLSSLPLLALASGLNHLRKLFNGYARGEYFSSSAAVHLGKVARGVLLWVGASFICTPLLGLWCTILAPEGERLFMISFTSADFVALFLAACIGVIARILLQASEVESENKTFV